MKLPLSVTIKNFLGIYVLTPLEQDLLRELERNLRADDREILAFQIKNFTTVRRLITHLDEDNAYGYTNFHTMKFGKNVTDARQKKRFPCDDKEALLATARVLFSEGEIDVQFWMVRGVLFSIEYRSPKNIYYPIGEYSIDNMKVLL